MSEIILFIYLFRISSYLFTVINNNNNYII